MITEIEKKIEERQLSLKDVDGLLLDISWLEHPEVIRKLLDYKKLPQESLAPVVKTDAEIKAEWKTEKLPDGTLRLANYKGSDTIVIIPEKIGKAVVTEIGAYALSVKKSPLKKEMRESRAKIKEVRIPSTIVTIGESAFEACENLEKVTWTSSLVTIAKGAFRECAKLKDVDLHKGIKTIGDFAFRECLAFEQVHVPEGVQLGEEVFYGCAKLKKVVLPNDIIELPYYIFAGCTNLLDINMPERLTTIGQCAFNNCKKLATLVIPETVNSIAVNQKYWRCGSFEDCKKLVLQVKPGSYAEQYAQKNGILYKAE